jgi:hypothetical protein
MVWTGTSRFLGVIIASNVQRPPTFSPLFDSGQLLRMFIRSFLLLSAVALSLVQCMCLILLQESRA